MQHFGLLGEKLSHSLSPQIHSLLFRELGIEASYDLLEVRREDLPRAMREARDNYVGLNVTIPYKTEVASFLTSVSEEACSIGAVNTIFFKAGEAFGYNTDYAGFGFLLKERGITAAGRRVAILGTGGATRAVLQYVSDQGAESILVVSRKPAQAGGLCAGIKLNVPVKLVDYAALAKRAGDVIINCTPVGMYPHEEASPVPAEILQNYDAAVDLIYNPPETMFLRKAKEKGCLTANGLLMLVAQAVYAEEIWLQKSIGEDVILRIARQLGGD